VGEGIPINRALPYSDDFALSEQLGAQAIGIFIIFVAIIQVTLKD
jgi:hypothetical protein